MNRVEVMDFLRRLGDEKDLLKKVGIYTTVLIFSVFVFVWFRFPVEELAPTIERQITKSGLPVKVKIGEGSLSFPPGVKLEKVEINKNIGNLSIPIFENGRLKISPAWLSLVRGSPGVKINAEIMGGKAWITGYGDDWSSKNGALDFEFHSIDTGKTKLWKLSPFAKFSGLISGEGTVRIIDANILKSSGNASLTLDGGSLAISNKVISSLKEPVKFDEGSADVSLDSGRLKIENFTIKGPEVGIDISGDVYLSNVARFTRLNLTIGLQITDKLKRKLGIIASLLPPEKNGRITLKLGGTMAAPQIR